MHGKDYYDILGVSRDVDAFELKAAFRRLARRFHPDVSAEPDAEEHFKAIAEAYEVLRDADKRAAYDALGLQWQDDDDHSLTAEQTAGVAQTSFDELFDDLFANDECGVRPEDLLGGDEQCDLDITVEEAFHGVTRLVHVGAKGARAVQIQVPPRVADGQRIRLAGRGRAGPGGRRGDLFVRVRIAPHRQFRISGRDVHTTVPVTPWEAALGADIEIPTLGGRCVLRVPAVSQTGDELCLEGRGLGESPRGDHYVRIEVHAPPVRRAADRLLLERMARQMGFDPRAASEES